MSGDDLKAFEADKMSPRELARKYEWWKDTWRRGFAPVMPTAGLEALRKALVEDDPTLVQGTTTQPPPQMCVQDWPVDACCAVAFCGWKGAEVDTVGDAEEFFAKACYEADQRLGNPADCRWFLDWFDDTPRDEVRALLLPEVERELALRGLASMAEARPAA